MATKIVPNSKRPKRPRNFDWEGLYKAAAAVKERMDYSWRTAAIVASVTPSIFTRISAGKPITVNNLGKVLWWAESEFEDFV